MNSHSTHNQADEHGTFYEIKLVGGLSDRRSDWIGDMKILQDEEGNTLLADLLPINLPSMAFWRRFGTLLSP